LCSTALTAHRARQLRWIDSAGKAWHDHGLIVTTRNLHRAFKARCSQIAVTMNVYSEVSTEDTREALRRLGERLSGETS
jgi:hypothetical protein